MGHWSTTAKDCVGCNASFVPARWSVRRCDACRSECSVDGCDRKPFQNGLCSAHSFRMKRFGDVGTPEIGVARHTGARSPKMPPLDVECYHCAKPFKKPYGLARAAGLDSRNFCSRKCYQITVGTPPMLTCGMCERPFMAPKNKADSRGMQINKKAKYCSVTCRIRAQSKDVVLDSRGYVLVAPPGGGKKNLFEHRVVMESVIGRPLRKEETVHHKDGNRTNNDPSNLELWSSRHGKGQRVEDKIEFCKSFLIDYGISVNAFSVSDYLSGQLAA